MSDAVEAVHLEQSDSSQSVWTLHGHRMKHSVVDLSEPFRLDFDYARVIADVIDSFPDGGITTVHVGGGARTLPRYISTCRPESTHLVVEPNPVVNALIASLPPIAELPNVTVLETDGRAGLAALADDMADLIIVDAFTDCIVPASLTTIEALLDMSRVLKPCGMVVLNLLDLRTMQYLHRVADTAQLAFAAVSAVADKHILGERGFGNVVLIAGPDVMTTAAIQHRCNAEVGAEHVVIERGCHDLIAHLLTDAYPQESPNLGW